MLSAPMDSLFVDDDEEFDGTIIFEDDIDWEALVFTLVGLFPKLQSKRKYHFFLLCLGR